MAKEKKLKVAFIHPDLGIGGAERLVIDLAVALTKQNHEVFFITNHFNKTHAFPELQNGQFPVKVIGDWLPRHVFGRFQALCAYIRMLYLSLVYVLFMRKEDKPDLYFTDLIPVANPILKLANEKVIYYCHHPDLLASPPGGKLKKLYRQPIDWFEGKATSKSDSILVNSEYTASVFRKTFPDITHQIEILYPTIASSFQDIVKGLSTPKPISELVPEIQSNASDNIVFLSFNRFHPAKKLELAILAMDQLKSFVSKEEWDKIYFILAGGFDPQSKVNADTFSQLRNLVKDKELEDKVIFLKSPPDSTKAELLHSCSCLVYTPVNEHFGIVPLEAMLVSKPVIACNSGGPRETVDHGVTGYLCEPNARSLAEFMKRILKEDRTKMGKAGKKRLDENFSTQYFEKCLWKIVDKTVNNNKLKIK
ncbi:alpha-1,3/1,6-mannosyltransferase ALG2 [Aethina tumida]|uniref:alpha-1,3/1,6-mannosyltransferase ALG2 n=1 Tax=Aethina tumida TaxID=116153 RepID=UPI002149521C|nr:alpha-1,3/1,6-mannosyltransferase ALG2 [Aethina tumida]